MTEYTPVPMTTLDVHEEVQRLIRKYVNKGTSVLDMAAGQGALSHFLKKNQYHVIAVDLTDQYWQLNDIPLKLMDFNQDFSQNFESKYDAICSVEIIEHIESPYHYLRECHKLLKEGGMLFLTTPNVDSIASRMIFLWNGRLRYFSEDETNNHHVTPIHGWYLRQACKNIGFEIVEESFNRHSWLIGDSFKHKLFSFFSRLLYPFLKGDKHGEIRILALKAIKYKKATSK